MKKSALGFATCIGFMSSILSFMNALPQYQNVFLVLIGVSLGYILGYFSNIKNNENQTRMDNSTKKIILTITLFILPVVLLILIILVLNMISILNETILLNVLSWAVVFFILMYIIGAIIIYDAYKLQSNNNTVVDEKSTLVN